jgi:hypothetical protein
MSAIVKRMGEGISGEVNGCTDGGAEAAVVGVSYCCSVNCVRDCCDCCVTTGAPVAGVTKLKLAEGVAGVAAVVEIKFGAESAPTEASSTSIMGWRATTTM